MAENKSGSGKPNIDREYLKKLAEKIKAEKAKKEAAQSSSHQRPSQQPPAPPSPPTPSIPPTLLDDDDENENMAAEKTAIIDLASLSGQNADAKLTIVDGKDEGKSIEITRDEVFCGRSLDNDFVISDISVSRKHFKIVKDGDSYKAEDMGSGNGIRVNGTKQSSITLYDGDLITAGARTIKFQYLNEDMKNKYGGVKESSSEQIVHGSKSSPLAWMSIILILLIAAVGAYFFINLQKQQTEIVKQQIKKSSGLSLEDIDRIDSMIDNKKIIEAEKVLSTYLSKYPNSKFLKERQKTILGEKGNQKKFEMGKKFAKQNKTAESKKMFRSIPEDSIFYPEVISFVGKDKLEDWILSDAKKAIKQKKTDDALKLLSSLLSENPSHAKAKQLLTQLTTKVGAKKVAKIKKQVARKKIAQQKARAKKRARLAKRRRRIARRRKAQARARARARAKAKAKAKAKAEKKKAAPKDPFAVDDFDSKKSYSKEDIDRAVDNYVSKDYDKALDMLAKIAKNSKNKAVVKRAKIYWKYIRRFQKYISMIEKETNYVRKKKIVSRLHKYDKRISGGKLKPMIDDYLKKGQTTDPFAVASSDSAGEAPAEIDIQGAKKLYMEARSLRDSNPRLAKEKYEKVLRMVPKGHKYYKKAQRALKKL